MNIKVALIDFDYTLTTQDTLDLLAKHLNVEAKTAKLDRLFWDGKLPGLQGLVRRINLLKGLSRQEIGEIVSNENILRDGAIELFEYFKKNKITTIIASGNILPVLEIANSKLKADYLVCSNPTMVDDKIDSISEDDYSGDDFKIRDCKAILNEFGILSDSVIAIGDSPADKVLFEFAKVSFAVEPKNGVEKFATYTVGGNLHEIIEILERI
jgi:HAD superfamily phosphoserine phosphatase-like hydrolase